MFRRLPAGDAPPFSFVLPKENGRARSKENRCVSKSYRWQVWTNTGVERDGAAEIQKSPAGCAIPLQTEIVLPRICGRGCGFRGSYRMVCPSGPAAAARMRQGSGSEQRRWSIRLPPRKQVGSFSLRRRSIPVPPMSSAPGKRLSAYTGTDYGNVRF